MPYSSLKFSLVLTILHPKDEIALPGALELGTEPGSRKTETTEKMVLSIGTRAVWRRKNKQWTRIWRGELQEPRSKEGGPGQGAMMSQGTRAEVWRRLDQKGNRRSGGTTESRKDRKGQWQKGWDLVGQRESLYQDSMLPVNWNRTQGPQISVSFWHQRPVKVTSKTHASSTCSAWPSEDSNLLLKLAWVKDNCIGVQTALTWLMAQVGARCHRMEFLFFSYFLLKKIGTCIPAISKKH